MQQVTLYRANNGRVYDTPRKALAEDIQEEIKKYASTLPCPGRYDSSFLADFISHWLHDANFHPSQFARRMRRWRKQLDAVTPRTNADSADSNADSDDIPF